MKQQKQEAKTAVSKVARRLRRQALSTAEGKLIGSEDDLVKKYRVSRPTLRQAAALLSQEQLLLIRRGVGGGYFARRPDFRAVTHMAAVYLQSRHTTIDEIIAAIEPINVEMAVLASKNRDSEIREQWRDFYARDQELNQSGGFRDFQKSQVEFVKLLGAACGNRVLELFVLTLYDFCGSLRPEEDMFVQRPDRVREYWARRMDLVKAIMEGDTDIAKLTSERCAKMITDWLSENSTKKSKARSRPIDIWEFPAIGG